MLNCKKCNSKLGIKDKFCNICGEPVVKNKRIPLYSFICISVLLVSLSIYQFVTIRQYSEDLDNAKTKISEYQDRIIDLKRQIPSYNDGVYFGTKYGKKYHAYSCHYIRDSDDMIYVYSSLEILRKGLEPCKECQK